MLDCRYFDSGVCRSCADLPVPYDEQVGRKERRVAAALPEVEWLPTVRSREGGFRNKAKMVASGRTGEVALGLIDADLTGCPIHEDGLRAALPVLRAWVDTTGLTPYDIPGRRGELKYVIATISPDRELMVRLVLRSREQLPLVERRLPDLLGALAEAGTPVRVASVNLHPEHKAVLEGDEEVVLHGDGLRGTLPMRVNGHVLDLGPRSFFQTNTEIAAALYREAAALADEAVSRRPAGSSTTSRVWDLYCGVGGFAAHLAAPGREVVGVDTAPGEGFVAADATAWAKAQVPAERPDLVVVNPPRRGVGAELADWLEGSGVREVVYSSCNVESLARDLAAMPSLRPVGARLFDMFPHTGHHEVMARLRRG